MQTGSPGSPFCNGQLSAAGDCHLLFAVDDGLLVEAIAEIVLDGIWIIENCFGITAAQYLASINDVVAVGNGQSFSFSVVGQ